TTPGSWPLALKAPARRLSARIGCANATRTESGLSESRPRRTTCAARPAHLCQRQIAMGKVIRTHGAADQPPLQQRHGILAQYLELRGSVPAFGDQPQLELLCQLGYGCQNGAACRVLQSLDEAGIHLQSGHRQALQIAQ